MASAVDDEMQANTVYRFMTTNFEPAIMSGICLPSSGVA